MAYSFDNFRSLFGVMFVLTIAWMFSSNRKLVPIGSVSKALGLLLIFAIIVFGIPAVRNALGGVTAFVSALQDATLKGTSFAFGYIGGGAAPYNVTAPENSFILAFQVLPIMIVISALSALFWHWGILDRLCRAIGVLFERSLGISGAAGLGVASSIFLGMIEAPMVVRPYLNRMPKSDIFLIMTTAMATIAGTVMALFIAILLPTLGQASWHVLAAAVLAAPTSIAIARIMYPPSVDLMIEKKIPPPKLYQSTMHAFAQGVQDGLQVLLYVIAMIIVAVAFIALIDAGLSSWFPPIGGEPLTSGRLMGWVLAPFVYLLGIPWADATEAGRLIGTKVTLNELLAFIELAKIKDGDIEPRTRVMMIYMLCGFANFGALAIMIGGLAHMCPNRRDDFFKLGIKSMFAGCLANMLNGAIVGCLPLALLI